MGGLPVTVQPGPRPRVHNGPTLALSPRLIVTLGRAVDLLFADLRRDAAVLPEDDDTATLVWLQRMAREVAPTIRADARIVGQPDANPGTLTPTEAGLHLGVTAARVAQMCRRRELAGTKEQGEWRVDAQEVERMVERRKERR